MTLQEIIDAIPLGKADTKVPGLGDFLLTKRQAMDWLEMIKDDMEESQ